MDYLFLTVGIVGGACTDVEQTFVKVTKFCKREQLLDIVKSTGNFFLQPLLCYGFLKITHDLTLINSKKLYFFLTSFFIFFLNDAESCFEFIHAKMK